mmetsp:Transcript_9082/g.16460  ORF Transcript_9082/g.16460 Transcript_9082/m.16460 type:complete len:238 (-) Transcript_9082:482-1195(-)
MQVVVVAFFLKGFVRVAGKGAYPLGLPSAHRYLPVAEVPHAGKSVHCVHFNVKEHDVVLSVLHLDQGLQAVLGGLGLNALHFEAPGEELANVGLVVDDEEELSGGHWGIPRLELACGGEDRPSRPRGHRGTSANGQAPLKLLSPLVDAIQDGRDSCGGIVLHIRGFRRRLHEGGVLLLFAGGGGSEWRGVRDFYGACIDIHDILSHIGRDDKVRDRYNVRACASRGRSLDRSCPLLF